MFIIIIHAIVVQCAMWHIQSFRVYPHTAYPYSQYFYNGHPGNQTLIYFYATTVPSWSKHVSLQYEGLITPYESSPWVEWRMAVNREGSDIVGGEGITADSALPIEHKEQEEEDPEARWCRRKRSRNSVYDIPMSKSGLDADAWRKPEKLLLNPSIGSS